MKAPVGRHLTFGKLTINRQTKKSLELQKWQLHRELFFRQQMNPVGTPSKTDAETDSTGGSPNNLIRGKQSARFEEAWTRSWAILVLTFFAF